MSRDSRGKGPVGQGEYEVRPGDCLNSIAFEHGFFWETLWNLGANEDLKKARKNPDVLLPGDRLTIPPLRVKTVTGGTAKRHTFQLKGVPARLRMRFLEDGEPLANEPYELRIDGVIHSGKLDPNGKLQLAIPPNAKEAEIRIGDATEWIQVALGSVDPVTEMTGIQGRLNDLGLCPGPIDGILGPKTKAALCRFQKQHSLKVTGAPDQDTRDKLEEVFGC